MVVLPTKTLTAPALPDDAPPDATTTDPDVPAAVVPLLNTMLPLEPLATALALRMVTAPDVDTVPEPLTTLTCPPLCPGNVVSPARITTAPPSLLLLVPTATLTEPAAPLVA